MPRSGRRTLLFEANHGRRIPPPDSSPAPEPSPSSSPRRPGRQARGGTAHRVGLAFVDGAGTAIAGAARHAAVVNYVLPGTPPRTLAGIPTFTRLVQREVWPGIDVEYCGQRELEYDLVVAAGADPRAARIEIDGGVPALAPDGSIVIDTAAGRFIQRPPHAYQQVDGRHVAVPSAYVLRGREIRFAVGQYDRTRPLVIDPVLVYSTYLGGAGAPSAGEAIAVDAAGDAFVTGSTSSPAFPVLSASQPTPGGASDAFVAKYSETAR
jgi:hypothetical protein